MTTLEKLIQALSKYPGSTEVNVVAMDLEEVTQVKYVFGPDCYSQYAPQTTKRLVLKVK